MRIHKRVVAVLILTLLTGWICFLAENEHVSATTTQDKINQATQEKNELEEQLNETNENLESLKETHSSLKNELKNLNGQLTQVSDNLEALELQIRDKNAEIDATLLALDEAIATEEWQYDSMVIRLRKMYEQNDTSYINAIINAGSLADMLNTADFFEKIAAYDRKQLNIFKENRKFIEEQEAILEAEKIELENLQTAAEAEKNKIAGLISQTSSSVSKYADDISKAEQEALEYEAEIKKKEEDLVYLKKLLAEELALSNKAANSTWRNISDVKFADGDRYLLANLIYCEAGGEPYEGQLAVGAVVINRVLSSVYPDTVVGVIYQRKQFSPVASGRLDLALASNKATARCYQAADEAMSGKTNVGTCVYFRTPVEGLSGITIGGHVFY